MYIVGPNSGQTKAVKHQVSFPDIGSQVSGNKSLAAPSDRHTRNKKFMQN